MNRQNNNQHPCPRADEAAAYAAGDRVEGMESHLVGCTACREVVMQTRGVMEKLASSPDEQGFDLTLPILARMRDEKRKVRTRLVCLRSAAAVAAVLAAGWFFTFQGKRDQPVDVAAEPLQDVEMLSETGSLHPEPKYDPPAGHQASGDVMEERSGPGSLAAAPAEDSVDAAKEVMDVAGAIRVPRVADVAGSPERSPDESDTLSAGDSVLRHAEAWLLSSQGSDGGWSAMAGGGQPNYDVGISSLAMLALSTSIHADDPRYARALENGSRYLMTRQNEDGRFGPDCTGSLYNHALACIALMAAREQVEPSGSDESIRLGVDLLVRSQKEDGGWTYLRAPRSRPNTLLSAWALLAVTRADQYGVNGLDRTLARGMQWMAGVVDAEGRAGYRERHDYPRGPETLTAAAALCLLRGDGPDTGTLRTMLQQIRGDVAVDGMEVDYYRLFFQATALREAGEHDSEAAGTLTRVLTELQDRESDMAGSWPPHDLWAKAGGRVYTTAMSVLALRDLDPSMVF